jgi:hypothetical protein
MFEPWGGFIVVAACGFAVLPTRELPSRKRISRKPN